MSHSMHGAMIGDGMLFRSIAETISAGKFRMAQTIAIGKSWRFSLARRRSGRRWPKPSRPTPEAGNAGDYSCAGICCSISFQALIFKRRQTQQSGSSPGIEVSAPQTEHGD